MQKLFYPFLFLLDLVFPRACAICGKSRTEVCETCLYLLPRAKNAEHSFIHPIFDYQDKIVRHLIWKFKYKNARSIAVGFGKVLYEEIIGDLGDGLPVSKSASFLLLPIPLHKKRLRERGYNQSELLVREIMRNDTEKIFISTSSALVRHRKTLPQAKSVKRALRLENLRGAFTASMNTVSGKHVLLIDDVTTTGATLVEARKVLLLAGARSVKAYSVAH